MYAVLFLFPPKIFNAAGCTTERRVDDANLSEFNNANSDLVQPDANVCVIDIE